MFGLLKFFYFKKIIFIVTSFFSLLDKEENPPEIPTNDRVIKLTRTV